MKKWKNDLEKKVINFGNILGDYKPVSEVPD